MANDAQKRQVVVIGGGPAGLTAAHRLVQADAKPIVLEKLDKVGGIARTENYKGYHFDMGGHRFFTKSAEVNQFWHEVLGPDFLRRPRLSRIYYHGRFFNYPLKLFNTLWGLGLVESILIILSYIRWQLFPYREEESFEQWVTNRFGRRLFKTFFESYTEKVWGIPCSKLKAEWAAQRIKDLSLRTAVVSMFVKPKKTIKTLIEEFDYPRRGPGMLWETVRRQVEERGGEVWLNANVVGIQREGNRICGVVVEHDGCRKVVPGTDFITSMPLTQFVKWLDPPPPTEVLAAADRLTYRDFLTVCLVVKKETLFPDNWIYIHDPTVKVGRIQNFKNWSPDMVPDLSTTSLGLEYFCNEGDALWRMSDADLIELGKRELEQIGLARYADIVDGAVFRVEKTYPVYDSDYRCHLEVLKRYLATFPNCQTVGRNGLHRYNNQDHAMLTGMYAVRNLLYGERHDLWKINAEEEYIEEVYDETVKTREVKTHEVETREVIETVQEAFTYAFPKLDPVAFGVAFGVVTGLALFAVTLFLVLKGGNVVGPNLGLLNQFLFGYSVTLAGAFVGLAYGFGIGLLGGFGTALLRNMATALYLTRTFHSEERSSLHTFIGYL